MRYNQLSQDMIYIMLAFGCETQ